MFMGLGDLPGGDFSSGANAISGDGSVVVGYGWGASSTEAFRWTSDGGMVSIQNPANGFADSEARAVSADGSVVAGSGTLPQQGPSVVVEPFRWTAEDGLAGLGHLEPNVDPNSHGSGISADGSVVVGFSLTGADYISQHYEAFRWTEADGLVSLGLRPGSFGAEASGVSADGSAVVGTDRDNTVVIIDGDAYGAGAEAFLWRAGQGTIGLGTVPGDHYSDAYAISADGSVVVGSSSVWQVEGDVVRTRTQAFRWTEAGGMVGLGALYGGDATALAVSGDGSVVVGHSDDVAFIWDPIHGMRSLQDVLTGDFGLDLSGWTLVEARGISSDGRIIVGSGENPNGDFEAWIAVLPEPSTSVLVVLGLAGLAGHLTASRRRATVRDDG
jgi:probable HAF family extracellular repeat protein